MTPTLLGRWQTRIFLMGIVGAVPTVLFMFAFDAYAKLALLLTYVIVLGLAWDALYMLLQRMRWDRDWPFAFHFASGLVEGAVVLALFAGGALPGVRYEAGDAARFAMHYGTLFFVSFVFVLGPMRVIFPRWRYRGGRVV